MEEISARAFQRGHQRLNDSVCPGNFQIAVALQKWATKPRSSATSESTEKRIRSKGNKNDPVPSLTVGCALCLHRPSKWEMSLDVVLVAGSFEISSLGNCPALSELCTQFPHHLSFEKTVKQLKKSLQTASMLKDLLKWKDDQLVIYSDVHYLPVRKPFFYG